jgi:hypothetical protein
VRQTRVNPGGRHTPYVNLDEIEFEGEVSLRFIVMEGDDVHGVEGIIVWTEKSATVR